MDDPQTRPVPAASPAEPPLCANCGVEIPWPAAIHQGRTYCCGGCAQGGPCYCSYDLANPTWLFPAPTSVTLGTAVPARRDRGNSG